MVMCWCCVLLCSVVMSDRKVNGGSAERLAAYICMYWLLISTM